MSDLNRLTDVIAAIYAKAPRMRAPTIYDYILGSSTAGPDEGFFSGLLERFPAKWMPVRVKKTRQNKEVEPPFRFNRNGKALESDSTQLNQTLASLPPRSFPRDLAERVSIANLMVEKGAA